MPDPFITKRINQINQAITGLIHLYDIDEKLREELLQEAKIFLVELEQLNNE